MLVDLEGLSQSSAHERFRRTHLVPTKRNRKKMVVVELQFWGVGCLLEGSVSNVRSILSLLFHFHSAQRLLFTEQ